MSTARTELFDSENIWKILLQIAPPVMLAQLIQSMYNIVDSYFVGRYSGEGLTALSVIYPIQLIVTAVAVGTGVGVNTLMSRFYGFGRSKKADKAAGTGTALAALSWLIFAVISTLIMRPFAMMSSESPVVVEYTIVYGNIVCIGSLGVFLLHIQRTALQIQIGLLVLSHAVDPLPVVRFKAQVKLIIIPSHVPVLPSGHADHGDLIQILPAFCPVIPGAVILPQKLLSVLIQEMHFPEISDHRPDFSV